MKDLPGVEVVELTTVEQEISSRAKAVVEKLEGVSQFSVYAKPIAELSALIIDLCKVVDRLPLIEAKVEEVWWDLRQPFRDLEAGAIVMDDDEIDSGGIGSLTSDAVALSPSEQVELSESVALEAVKQADSIKPVPYWRNNFNRRR